MDFLLLFKKIIKNQALNFKLNKAYKANYKFAPYITLYKKNISRFIFVYFLWRTYRIGSKGRRES